MNEIKVLASVYKVIAESNENILEKLSKSKNQPREILDVVLALKKAKKALDTQVEKKEGIKKALTPRKTGGFTISWNPQSKRLWESILNAFEDKKTYHITNKSFIQAFTNSGLQTSARAKDGKQLVVLKIEKSLSDLDNSKRTKILGSVLSCMGLSQTKGYIEAIRSKKH